MVLGKQSMRPHYFGICTDVYVRGLALGGKAVSLPSKCEAIKLAVVLLEHILLYLETHAVVPTRVLLAALPPQQAGGYQLVGTRYPTLWFKFSDECHIDLGSAQLRWVQKCESGEQTRLGAKHR